MSDQYEAARTGLEDGLQRVEEHADPEWLEAALLAIRQTCVLRTEFISDHVWRLGGLIGTRENRALGPMMLRAQAWGWCLRTNRLRASVRSHLAGKPIWKSLLFGERALKGTGITMIENVNAFKTSDGQVHNSLVEAQEHELASILHKGLDGAKLDANGVKIVAETLLKARDQVVALLSIGQQKKPAKKARRRSDAKPPAQAAA